MKSHLPSVFSSNCDQYCTCIVTLPQPKPFLLLVPETRRMIKWSWICISLHRPRGPYHNGHIIAFTWMYYQAKKRLILNWHSKRNSIEYDTNLNTIRCPSSNGYMWFGTSNGYIKITKGPGGMMFEYCNLIGRETFVRVFLTLSKAPCWRWLVMHWIEHNQPIVSTTFES